MWYHNFSNMKLTVLVVEGVRVGGGGGGRFGRFKAFSSHRGPLSALSYLCDATGLGNPSCQVTRPAGLLTASIPAVALAGDPAVPVYAQAREDHLCKITLGLAALHRCCARGCMLRGGERGGWQGRASTPSCSIEGVVCLPGAPGPVGRLCTEPTGDGPGHATSRSKGHAAKPSQDYMSKGMAEA